MTGRVREVSGRIAKLPTWSKTLVAFVALVLSVARPARSATARPFAKVLLVVGDGTTIGCGYVGIGAGIGF